MHIRFATIFVVVSILGSVAVESASAASRATAYPARVSDNHRYLIDQYGDPFFYLGDTAWELFHRLSRAEAEHYLQDRAAKRFTVIQAVILAEFGGLVEPDRQGALPLVNRDPTKPDPAFFKNVDTIVNKADELGLVIGMLPTWGDKWNKKWGEGPEIFTPENALFYGEFLGQRYREKPVIWILGGDRPVESDRQKAIIRAMAVGLKKGDQGRHLITFHPNGGHSSAQWFQTEDWLDFHMIQSGHGYDHPNYERVAADYAIEPAKPCMDGEPGYEDHPADFNAKNGYLDDYETRKHAYWALFAGAHGHTYGCHDVWQFLGPSHPPITAARTPWKQAINLPGAGQMQFVRALLESRPILSRIPDQTLLVSNPGRGPDHVQATRAYDGSYAFIYSASGRAFTVDLGKLTGKRVRGCWYDPRTGNSAHAVVLAREGQHTFKPPTQGKGCDWVLVLDDESKLFRMPGKSS